MQISRGEKVVLSKIVLWFILLWLIGSVIYSTRFHISNFLNRKKKIKSEEVGELYESIHGRFNIKLVLLQTVKLFLAGLIFYFLLDWDNSSSDEAIWTEEKQQWFLEGCKGEEAIKGWSQIETDEYCDCFLEKLIEVIPDPTIYEGGNLPESIVREIQLKCFDIIK